MISFKDIFNYNDGPMDDEELDQDMDYQQEESSGSGAEENFSRRSRRERTSSSGGEFSRSGANMDVVLVKPEKYDAATSIADRLNERKAVVLNLESADKEVARRLVDFLSGVAYANGGDIQRVATSTFLITPSNMNLTSGQSEDEVDGSIYF